MQWTLWKLKRHYANGHYANNTMEMKKFITKSNYFRKTVIEKQEEIKACEENLRN